MSRTRAFSLLAALAAVVLIAAPSVVARDENNDNGGGRGALSAEPWIYVGKAGDCGADYPAGSRIVTSAWLGGMGLPDDGTSPNTLVSGPGLPPAGSRNDPHLGLLLNKNGPTPDCSSAGATINGVRNMVVTTGFTVGFDYRLGGHCGGGAPRFNVTTKPATSSTPETFHFIGGCGNFVPAVATQDPAQWARARFILTDPSVAGPALTPGDRIVSIELILDEGTDTPSVSDPTGIGLAVLDNIYINGTTITRGSGIEPGSGHRQDDNHGGHGDNNGGRNND